MKKVIIVSVHRFSQPPSYRKLFSCSNDFSDPTELRKKVEKFKKSQLFQQQNALNGSDSSAKKPLHNKTSPIKKCRLTVYLVKKANQ